MATPAQIAANQRNEQLSTGPKSDEGKSRSARNALKSGLDAQSPLIPGESPDAFAQLQDEYYSRYVPTDPEQRFYLDSAILSEWLLRRFKRVEEQLWALAASRIEKPVAGLELGQSFDQDNKVIMRLHRRVVHTRKTYQQAMDTFHRLQAETAPPQPEEIQPPLPKFASFRPTDYRGPSDPFLDAMEARLRHMGVPIGPIEPDPDPDPSGSQTDQKG